MGSAYLPCSLACSRPRTNMIAVQVKDLSNNPRPQAKVPHPPLFICFFLLSLSALWCGGTDSQVLSLARSHALPYTLYILSSVLYINVRPRVSSFMSERTKKLIIYSLTDLQSHKNLN